MFTSIIRSTFLSAGIIFCLSSCDSGNRNSNNDANLEDSTSQLDRGINESDRHMKNPTVDDEKQVIEWENIEIPAAVRQSIEQDGKFQEKQIDRTMTSKQNGKTLYLVIFKSDTSRYVFDEQGKLQPSTDYRE